MAEILIDDEDAFGGPAEGEGSLAQGVLTGGALSIGEDLLERALAHIETGESLQMTRGDLLDGHHDTSGRVSTRRGRERTSGRPLWRSVQFVEERSECLEIGEAQDGTSVSSLTEGVRGSEGRPGDGKGTDMARARIAEEDAGFSPRPPLREEGELLIREGMEGMGDGEADVVIRVIGCS